MGLFDMFKKKAEPAAAAAPASISASAGADVLCSPVKGKVIKMADVPDPVFGGEVLGKGCAVWPEDDLVYAPCDGKVTVTMGHAVGLQSDNGIEVLVHVGVDTVNMNGDGFEGFVKADDVDLVFVLSPASFCKILHFPSFFGCNRLAKIYIFSGKFIRLSPDFSGVVFFEYNENLLNKNVNYSFVVLVICPGDTITRFCRRCISRVICPGDRKVLLFLSLLLHHLPLCLHIYNPDIHAIQIVYLS